MHATLVLPACLARNRRAYDLSLMKPPTVASFRDLKPHCQLHIFLGAHFVLVRKTLGQGRGVIKWADGWDGLHQLGEFNYWPPSSAFATYCEQHQLNQMPCSIASQCEGQIAVGCLDDWRTGKCSCQLLSSVACGTRTNEAAFVGYCCTGSHCDNRGSPPVPLQGPSHLNPRDIPGLFDQIAKMPVDWAMVLQKKQHLLRVEAIGFLRSKVEEARLPSGTQNSTDGPLQRDFAKLRDNQPDQEALVVPEGMPLEKLK